MILHCWRGHSPCLPPPPDPVRPSTLILSASLLLTTLPAWGRSVSVRSDTLTTAGGLRPEFGADDVRSQVLLLELLRVATEDVGVDGLQAEVSGLAGAHVGPPPLDAPGVEGDRFVGSLLVGLVRWHSKKNTVRLALGRQYLFAGGGRAEHLDGLTATYLTPWNIDATVFGGRTTPWQLDLDSPTPEDEAWYFSNYAAGGRLRFRALEHALASVGFIHEGNGGELVRQSLTFDVGYWRLRAIEGLCGGVIDLAEGAPQELWVQLISRPVTGLKLTADYGYLVPALLIPRTSIFSVFATETSYHDASLGLHWALTDWLTAGAEGGVRLFPDEDSALGYTVAASARVTADGRRFVGLRVELLDVIEERQLQARLYGLYHLAFGLYASADLHLLLFDVQDAARASIFALRRDDQRYSVGGVGLLGYRITPRLSAQVAGSAFTTPAASRDLRLIGRLTFDGDWGSP